VASALQMGADLAYMGTRFINTDESVAPEAYKKMIVDAGANDVVYTAAISGVHANFLAASLEAAGITAEDLKKDVKIDFGKVIRYRSESLENHLVCRTRRHHYQRQYFCESAC